MQIHQQSRKLLEKSKSWEGFSRQPGLGSWDPRIRDPRIWYSRILGYQILGSWNLGSQILGFQDPREKPIQLNILQLLVVHYLSEREDNQVFFSESIIIHKSGAYGPNLVNVRFQKRNPAVPGWLDPEGILKES